MKKFKKIFSSLILLVLFLFISNSSFAHFGSKGPYGGSVSCSIVYDTTVYIGTTEGGVFFSGNSNLLSWIAKPVGLKSGKITALAHTGSYLFAATADSGIFIYTGFVGTDRYWKKINTGLTNLKITSLVAIDSITVLAGTNGSGIFKTTNKGATWVDVNSTLMHFDITAFAKAGNRIIHTSDGGVWASDDKGDTWFDFNDANTHDNNTTEISYNAAIDEILISNVIGLYSAPSASTTGTPVFTLVQTGLPSNTTVRDISNNATNWYLATDKGVYTSPSGTINWINANTGLITLDVNAIIPFQTRLVAGTNHEGIFKTAASTISWTVVNTGYNNIATYSMITNGATVVIAATEKGIFVSKDLAATYKRGNSGLTDSLNVTDLTFLGTKLFATTKNAGVFISVDTGKTWNLFNVGLTNMSIKKVIASNSNVYIFNSTGEVYQSNGVTSWSIIQTGLPSGVSPTSLAFFGTTMILGTYGNGVYTKNEMASIWISSNTGLSDLNVTSVTASAGSLFAGTDGAGVFVSNPNTINWNAAANLSIAHTITMGLEGKKIQAMAYNAGYVFASYKGGLLASSDSGATWIAGGNQFNLPSYTNVNKISFVTTRVFVTTEHNCLYSNSLAELPAITGIKEVSVVTPKIIISPNPNNGIFTVDLNNIKGEIKDITVYDVVGKIVNQINKNTLSSSISITMNSPAGIYFVKVNTNKGMSVQKIIIE